MTKHAPQYRPRTQTARTAAFFLLLILSAQAFSPLHSWLESTARTVHHDGFIWGMPVSSQKGCADADTDASHCLTEADVQGEGCQASDCQDGACQDSDCNDCCRYIPIQSTVSSFALDTYALSSDAQDTPALSLLHGILPVPFLPPRS